MRLKPLKGNWTENLGNCLKTDHNNSTDGGGDNNSNNNNMLVSLIETSVGKMAYCTISWSPLSNPNYYLCRRAEETETLPLVDPMNTV